MREYDLPDGEPTEHKGMKPPVEDRTEQLRQENEKLQRAVRELAVQGDVARAVGACKSSAEIMQTIIERSIGAVDAERGMITLVDPADDSSMKTLARARGAANERESFLLKQTLIGWMTMNQKPLVVNSTEEDSRFRGSNEGGKLRSILAVPMMVESVIRGVLSVFNKNGEEGWTAGDERILSIIGGQSAQVLENALLREREKELLASREKALLADRAKSMFLANMSHELRTPLGAILGYSELLIDEAGDRGLEGMIGDLKKIQTAAKHQLDLINSILDLSKIEAGKTELFLETFGVRDLVDEVVGILEPLVSQKGNTLKVECADEMGKMHADLMKVRQSLFNLISNASKFTEKGTIGLSVTRETRKGEEMILFVVSDSGIGMTAEELRKLFQPFAQADASTTTKFGGTGLGLAITKKFCELMGGAIDVESESGRGTSFTILIPANVGNPKSIDG